MTIPQRILWHVTVGAGLAIAIATAATYQIVYRAATNRELKHLETYVTERARREELGFRQVEANLRLVRGQFLKRISNPIPADYQMKWDARFRLFPDGAWRSREEFADGRKFSTLWAHKDVEFTPELKTIVLRAQDICDELLPGWMESFPSVYFVLPGWLNIGFDPRIPNWVWQTPAEYNPSGLEWFQIALPANATRSGFAWSGVIEEPTTKVPIVSVYLPVEQEGRFIGSIGHDLFVNRLIGESTQSGLEGATHVIFRRDGRLIAHPAKQREILASAGTLRMQASGDPALANLYRAVHTREERQFSGYDPDSQSHFSVARLAGPEWFFLTTIPRDLLRQQAFQTAQWVLWSGLVSLALLLGFLARTLRRQIAIPLAELTRATKEMSAGGTSARAAVGRMDEFGMLARSFNEMAERVSERDAALRAEKASLETRVQERTAELARFASIAEATGDFFGFADLSERILYINPAGRRLLGWPLEEPLSGLAIADVHAGPAYEKLRSELIPAALRNGSCSGETVLRRRDGKELPASLMLVIPRDSAGSPMFVSAIMRDITDLKRAETELRKTLERERELGELKSSFVSLVSHEFRTPLEIIISSADNLDRYHDRLPPEKRRQLLSTINKAVRRMAGMMEEVLVLGRLETERMTFSPSRMDLPSLFRKMADEIESATGRRCPLRLRFSGDLEGAHGDESLLRHVFTNLLSNAVKYSETGSPVDISVERDGERAVCRVIDHGCGIPAADQPRLFQAFHRGANVRQIPGTGLGLLIVQRCVDLQRGKLEFESLEGRGTTFVVTLPLFAENPQENPMI